MRKITEKISNSFLNRNSAACGNTSTDGQSYFLHGNKIAEWRGAELWVTDAGWKTVTTRDRLNALPNVQIWQSKGEQYLNGKTWNGDWIKV